VTLDGDAVRLTQVLVNLLNNASKFTPQGGHIWLIAETSGERADRPDQVRIRIRDTGVGIAQEFLPKIFDMFMQGDVSLERSQAGLGVGLTLVRNLVALHGGTVDVRSEGEGAGSEFTVCLPIEPKAQAPHTANEAVSDGPSVKPLRILVADDNDDGRELLMYLLTADGHTVAQAPDGRTAVETATAFRPDVVILDIGMPGMNGYAVAQTLRKSGDMSSVVLVACRDWGSKRTKLAPRKRASIATSPSPWTSTLYEHSSQSQIVVTCSSSGSASRRCRRPQGPVACPLRWNPRVRHRCARRLMRRS
jgi:two-component system CheB/CheR fusion protein